MRLKENSLLLPARFLLGRKKGRAKSHVYYLDLLAHPLGGYWWILKSVSYFFSAAACG